MTDGMTHVSIALRTIAPPRLARSARLALVSLACVVGCATSYRTSNTLGVLPPQPPQPLWMGAIHPESNPAMRGAAAITATRTPGYSHVLVSIWGGTPGHSYPWTLHSGSCGSVGATIPVAGYPLATYADGTAKAEGSVSEKLTPNAPYSVVIGAADASTPPACADLAYGSM